MSVMDHFGELYLEAAFSLDNLAIWNAPAEAKEMLRDTGTISEQITGARGVEGCSSLAIRHRTFVEWLESTRGRKITPAKG